jgi:hypothetical protein
MPSEDFRIIMDGRKIPGCINISRITKIEI